MKWHNRRLLQGTDGMKRYSMIAALLLGVFLAIFLLVEALNVPLLKEPSSWLEQAGVLTGFVGVCLLVADVALPVPSSMVMVAHGARFGVEVGTFLSLVGSTGATLAGFAIGRGSEPLITRFTKPQERAWANRVLARWGALAIVVTRPIPILAETVAILAGASPLGWVRTTLAGLAGALPAALLYALAGAVTARFQNWALFLLVLLISVGSFWLVDRLAISRSAQGKM
jgi:uncharacterized membrane protein YdjX (TVP38/TMEM64 family)